MSPHEWPTWLPLWLDRARWPEWLRVADRIATVLLLAAFLLLVRSA